MRYREMKAVLAAIERADGCYLLHCALAEQPAGDWWVVVRDYKRSTDHQIDDDRRFVATVPDLDRSALAVLAPRFPKARLSWGDVVRLIPRLDGSYPAGTLDRIVRTAEGYDAIGMRDGETGRGGFICAPDDVP